MRIAIVGLGGACHRGHLPAIERLADRGFEIVAAADTSELRRTEFARAAPRAQLFADPEQMLDEVRCDILVVATDPGGHRDLVVSAITRGLHVVCEKPLTTSRADLSAIAQACAQRPDRALVSLHQYRCSPAWRRISRLARLASRLHLPYALAVNVERDGIDRHARNAWRADIDSSGGMLADTGVHFLALGWTISRRIAVQSAERRIDAGCEQSSATVWTGCGTMTIRLWNGAPRRHTAIELRLGPLVVDWVDDRLMRSLGGRLLTDRRVVAISAREHVDALYVPFYREVAAQLGRSRWRRRRVAETLAVGDALVSALEHASASTAMVPSP
ncbi:MAG TPA: Gfo/Idh/MocA family oxidoreductase [Conexibacter sp.]|nr:Gfo/Idh/MocA family oxidoreductase [Conexibacter sp.]